MNYGPELLRGLLPELQLYRGRPLQRIDAGADWCALTLRGLAPLFFSWNPEFAGICSFNSGRVKALGRSQRGKTPFVLGLQRHLVGSILKEATQCRQDRVLALRFQRFLGGGTSREATLILELMGRLSNAILLDQDNKILEAAKHLHPDRNRYRTVVPGRPYVPPPPLEAHPMEPSMDDDALAQALERPLGLGKVAATRLMELWHQGERSRVREALFGPGLVFQSLGNYLTALGTLLPQAEVLEGSGLEICRAFTAQAMESQALKRISAQALKELQRQKGRRCKHIDDLQLQIHRAEQSGAMAAAGQAILNNLEKLKGKTGKVTLTYWNAQGEKTIEVELDPRLDPSGNAQRYFKLYQKYRTDVDAAQAKIQRLEEELDDIGALEDNITRLETPDLLAELCRQVAEHYGSKPAAAKKEPKRKGYRPLPPHLRFSVEGATILVGMNEGGNRYVTFRAAGPEDLWFHVHQRPGAHVILKSPPKEGEARDRLIRAAASLALYYSSAQETTAAVDCTEKKQVRSIAGGGPGQVTYRHPQTVVVHREEWKEVLSEPR